MKLWLAVPALTVLVLGFDLTPAITAERACRPSLSNFYHCPDNDTSSSAPSSRATNATKKCVPSASNFWTCPDGSKPRTTTSTRTCRPSLSNGYHCPGTTSASPSVERETPRANRETPARERRDTNTTASTERACRPSLSNGYKCPGSPSPSEKSSDAAQFPTERQARAHCPPIQLSGQIHTQTFITFVARRTMEPRKQALTCASRTRSAKACAQPRMKLIPRRDMIRVS